jgi:hypothetical protein
MYVFAHKERVMVGPMGWNRALFDGALEKLKIVRTLPRNAPPAEELPMIIDEDTAIYPAEFDYPDYNKTTQYLEGPYWTFADGKATAGYLVKDQPVEFIKVALKQQVADERYNKEVSGTTVTIQGTVIALSTARDGRDSFAQKYVLMGDSDSIRWKFAEGWFTLNKTEVASIANAINAHVQSAFDWESSKSDEIESKTTAEELDAVVIVEPTEEPTPE